MNTMSPSRLRRLVPVWHDHRYDGLAKLSFCSLATIEAKTLAETLLDRYRDEKPYEAPEQTPKRVPARAPEEEAQVR